MVRHKTGTLSGSAQNLLALLYGLPLIPANDHSCCFLSLQSDPNATGAIFIGDENLTTTDYGVRLPVPVTSIPAAPYVIGPSSGESPLKLSSVYVIGTAADKLHVLFVVR